MKAKRQKKKGYIIAQVREKGETAYIYIYIYAVFPDILRIRYIPGKQQKKKKETLLYML